MKSPSIFGDKRLDKDYLNLIQEMSASGSSVINRAYKKSSDKKAAYRFINNENVTVRRIADDLISQAVTNVRKKRIQGSSCSAGHNGNGQGQCGQATSEKRPYGS